MKKFRTLFAMLLCVVLVGAFTNVPKVKAARTIYLDSGAGNELISVTSGGKTLEMTASGGTENAHVNITVHFGSTIYDTFTLYAGETESVYLPLSPRDITLYGKLYDKTTKALSFEYVCYSTSGMNITYSY